ncbi:VOC family protein [Citricoccus sp.]|uniref:VOC family protein n=1 Tax=Citricoccus sp. TaxID=1978372 RepID=UPI0028BEABA3|nr:VOC family protein [Citricoccus sp.]
MSFTAPDAAIDPVALRRRSVQHQPISGRPAADLLPAGLSLGIVTLKSDNVARLRAYYEQALGLVAIAEDGPNVVLGRSGVPLVGIEEARGLTLPADGEAGLYHVAILFEEAADLAATVYSAVRLDPTRFVGSSDHLVSEAFYFQDPDNNGIELYVDRPRDRWKWGPDGQLAMTTLYLPWDRYLDTHLTEEAVNRLTTAPASVGHVHLQVGDVHAAEDFYVRELGFEKTTALGSMALFVSAGGYHHHMAMNTWNSTGAGPRRNTLGLGSLEITLPRGEGLESAADRLKSAGRPAQRTDRGLEVRDPWNTLLVLSEPEVEAEAEAN